MKRLAGGGIKNNSNADEMSRDIGVQTILAIRSS